MDEVKVTGHIRPIAICVFRNGNRILVGDGYDPTKQQVFYRPPGGAIHFGETSESALRREMREELGVEIHHPRLIGVLESLFTFDGEQGHQIVFVFDGKLGDASLYELAQFPARESNGEHFNAIWLDLDAIGPGTPPVYPDGLVELLRRADDGARVENPHTNRGRQTKDPMAFGW
ncbi:MAG: NUDIX hydrolase [Candidatus Hydrogenedentes bacterium]|nr:NUDIX hydrolase [Candidatus Hydrogenedentota bacterium]